MRSVRSALGKNLRALIAKKGYRTIELFAHENDIDKGWLYRVINGKVDPSFSRVVKLAKALGVGLEKLYPGKK
jgi:transcriptional regulator with XRE-family HTH domain